MPWVPINSVERSANLMISRMSSGQELTLKSKKKDRSVSIIKNGTEYEILENGFEKSEYTISDGKELEKLLKRIIKIEFPRSHEVLFAMSKQKRLSSN